MATSPRATVLVGDDEPLVRNLVERAFLLECFASTAQVRAVEDVLGLPREGE